MATPIKHLKAFIFLPLLVSLYGCPDENDCNEFMTGGIAEVPDLISIEPLQETYQKGDEIILKCSVASTNNYFGEEISLFQETGNHSALLTVGQMYGFERLFEGANELVFIKGIQGEYPNWLILSYNSTNHFYELEVKIKLNNVGEYGTISSSYIVFKGVKNCNRFRLDTSIIGGINNEIHFIVVE